MLTIYVDQAGQQLEDAHIDLFRAARTEAMNRVDKDYKIKFDVLDPNYPYPEYVLVLGNQRLHNTQKNTKVVHTYTLKQLLTRPNALTTLTNSIVALLDDRAVDALPHCIRGTLSLNDFCSDHHFDLDEPIFIDIETGGQLGKVHTPDEVWPISISFYQPGAGSFVYVSKDTPDLEEAGSVPLPQDDPNIVAILQAIKKPVYHNGKFDTRVLNRWYDIELPIWGDTMLMHHSLNHSAGEHGLKVLAQRYFGANDWDAPLKGVKDYASVPVQELARYSTLDVYWTSRLYEYLAPLIAEDEEAYKAYLFELSVSHFLRDVEQNGIPIDSGYLSEYETALSESYETYRNTLQLMALVDGLQDFNLNSPHQIKEWFLLHGITLKKTDEATLSEYVEVDPGKASETVSIIAATILQARKVKKRLSTYVKGWGVVARNGRVHPTFHVHGTRTGRLSSSNPNAQNMPREKEVRKIVGVS